MMFLCMCSIQRCLSDPWFFTLMNILVEKLRAMQLFPETIFHRISRISDNAIPWKLRKIWMTNLLVLASCKKLRCLTVKLYIGTIFLFFYLIVKYIAPAKDAGSCQCTLILLNAAFKNCNLRKLRLKSWRIFLLRRLWDLDWLWLLKTVEVILIFSVVCWWVFYSLELDWDGIYIYFGIEVCVCY